ncbi:Ldh family oxidoreductase [Pseudomonas sp. R5(2019)]|uniref:Ldh family oxidoreductase n=1 Tax=Pseudomonas sp. R5(2019) TaxID=2697566 RepID=UPI0014126299|nr:Ldh family oxidoreductase [Pseudomonas sp. R5(2019)]NBA94892.1 Ldh family oxidoreductase [Pseudomonas sp. R5(2019)]
MDHPQAMKHLSLEQAFAFAQQRCLAHGTSEPVALSLAQATVDAEAHGLPEVGFSHLADYLDGFACSRIHPTVEPTLTHPAPAMIRCDARKGIAQLGFDRAFIPLRNAARQLGIALFAQHNGFTCGELGYYTRRLADEGLVGLGFTNGPPLLTVSGQGQPMYSTNPLAFAARAADGRKVLLDQSSSATAFVKILKAAHANEPIPAGWAVDARGQETQNARDALQGALLAFGGHRGANIALMIEVLAAGMTGANWSLDSASFRQGSESPGSGLLVIAIAPHLLDEHFEQRLAQQLTRLEALGVHRPGKAKEEAYARARREGIKLPWGLYEQLASMS